MWLVSLVGILSTAVVFGTDMFFLTIGRAALRMASPSAGTEIMGFFHMFADARMPIWGVLAILSNLLLVVLSRSAVGLSDRVAQAEPDLFYMQRLHLKYYLPQKGFRLEQKSKLRRIGAHLFLLLARRAPKKTGLTPQ
jgi:hypothetical protein